MNKSNFFLFVGILFFFFGCGPSREKSVKAIMNLDKQLFSSEAVSFNRAKADSLLVLYDVFIKDHPKDSLRPGFLFKAANLAMNLNNGNKAIAYFDQYIKDYPDGQKVPIGMFFKAFIYENMLKNIDKAREAYLQFIERFPNNEFADDAQMALQNLGKSPDQMVREFEAKRKADSLANAKQIKGKAKRK